MAKRKRNVEILSPKITYSGIKHKNVAFSDLLKLVNGKTINYEAKEYEFNLKKTDISDCIIGIIETMQSKDLPPKKNLLTKQTSQLPIDLKTERLVFANVFLYDTKRNILIYEVNKNGCYPDYLTKAIYYYWKTKYKEVEESIELNFVAIARKNQYERVLKMGYYKRLRAEILRPKELIAKYDEKSDSISNNIIKHTLESGAANNADTVVIEQLAITKKLNPAGLEKTKIKDIVDSVRTLSSEYISELYIQGYFTDPESPKSIKTISLLTDIFNEWFYLTEVKLHSDVQPTERVSQIEVLYERLLPEFKGIIGY